MQKNGLTNSSLMVWSGLEKCITHECDHYGEGKSQCFVYLAIFSMVTNDQTKMYLWTCLFLTLW